MNAAASRGSTSVTVLTAEGRSAIAVVMVSGPNAEQAVDRHFQAASGLPLNQQPLGRIVYGQWGRGIGEDLVVCRRGQGRVEVHCHGGVASTAQVVDRLSASGCEQLSWQQWLAEQAQDLLVCETHLALAEACTLRTAKILLDQFHGSLHCALMAIRLLLCEGATRIAHERLTSLLDNVALGQHLTQPWRLVIAGYPNVGKSSLINAIVGYQRAIVFDQPGTTRDVVSATTAIEGWPVRFSDTAGLHQTADELENAGIALAHDQLAEADLVIWVLDAQAAEGCADLPLEKLIDQQLAATGVEIERSSMLVVVNKIDLVGPLELGEKIALAISAQYGTGLDELLEAIAHSLVPLAPAAGTAVPFTSRQVSLLEQAADCCQQEQSEQATAAIAKLFSQND